MNTHFVKIISSIALTVGFAQSSFASSDGNTDACLPADTKKREINYKIRAIDLTSKAQPMSHFKEILFDRKTKGFSSLSSGDSFLIYQTNGQSFMKVFRVKNRIYCSVPNGKKISVPDVTEVSDNKN